MNTILRFALAAVLVLAVLRQAEAGDKIDIKGKVAVVTGEIVLADGDAMMVKCVWVLRSPAHVSWAAGGQTAGGRRYAAGGRSVMHTAGRLEPSASPRNSARTAVGDG